MAEANVKDALANGGLVTVALGKDYDIPPDFDMHPAVHAVAANTLNLHDLHKEIPSNTKILVLSDRIAQNVYEGLRKECERRRIPYMTRRSKEALAATLTDIVPKRSFVNIRLAAPVGDTAPVTAIDTPADGGAAKKVIAPKGALASFIVQEADLSKGVAEEARRLFGLAQQRNLPTTIASLEQGIRMQKRKGGRTDEPESIVPQKLKILRTFDDAIANLKAVRDWVESTDTELNDLRTKMEIFRETLNLK